MKKIVLSIILMLASAVISVQTSASADDPQLLLNDAVPEQYQVVAGDTLWDISRMYEGLTIQRIKQLNDSIPYWETAQDAMKNGLGKNFQGFLEALETTLKSQQTKF